MWRKLNGLIRYVITLVNLFTHVHSKLNVQKYVNMFQSLGKLYLSLESPYVMDQSFHYGIITSAQSSSVHTQTSLFALTDFSALLEGYNKTVQSSDCNKVWFFTSSL